MNILKKSALMFMVLMMTSTSLVYAYKDEVGAPIKEVYQAVLQIFGEEFLDEADPEKGVIYSDWVEDRVLRKNKIVFFKTKKEYIRRAKYKVTLKEWPTYTEVGVLAKFQFKPGDAKLSTPWRTLSPQRADREQEALLFRRILTQIERNRSRT